MTGHDGLADGAAARGQPSATSRRRRATSSRPGSTAACRRRPGGRQARMYDALTPLFDDVKPATSRATSSPRSSAPKGQGRLRASASRAAGVRILRDRFNVPHIYGSTNDDVTWGAGWALAHDRELLLEQARYNARVAVIDAPGIRRDRPDRRPEELRPSAQTEREVARRSGSCKAYGRRGRRCSTTSTSTSRGSTPTTRRERRPPALDDPRRDRAERDQERALRRGRR